MDMNVADNNRLDELNASVDGAIQARTDWLDQKMAQYAKVQVGEEIYNIDTGQRLGVVSKHYRYQAGQNKLFDTRLSISYEYETSSGCFDNTSRQGIPVGGKE
jgi:hypothetical protein